MRELGWIVLGMIAFILVMVLLPTDDHGASNKAKARATITQTYYIQLAIERYRDNNGAYPEDTEVLLKEGYLENFPPNSFMAHRRPPAADLYMKNVTLSAVDYAGNFSYQPVFKNGKAISYSLSAFAPKSGESPDSGIAAEHLVVTFGPMTPEEKAALREEERKWKAKAGL